MFCLELGVIFFSRGDFKPQNIELQNVGPWQSSGAGEGEENIEVMVILSDSCVFDLFFWRLNGLFQRCMRAPGCRWSKKKMASPFISYRHL